MKLLLLIAATGTTLVSPSVVGAAAAQTSSSKTMPRFIVLCDSDTSAKQARIQHSIRKVGGKAVLKYRNLGGFAVEPSNVRYVPSLEQNLRRIAGVTSVEADGIVSANSPSRSQHLNRN